MSSFPGNRTCVFKNATVINANVYTVSDVSNETLFVHNRWLHTYKPLTGVYNAGDTKIGFVAAIVDGFHYNFGHCILDNLYAIWHSIYLLLGSSVAAIANVQFITLNKDPQPGGKKWPFNILNKFAGINVKHISEFDNVMFEYIVIGNGGKGLSVLHPKLIPGKTEMNDPVYIFSSRFHKRFGTNNVEREKIVTIVQQKRKLTIENPKLPMGWKIIRLRWEDMTFLQQLVMLKKTSILVVGVGTARSNSFLLSKGSVEVQTGHISKYKTNHVHFYDSHFSSFLDHVRVLCPKQYSLREYDTKTIRIDYIIHDAIAQMNSRNNRYNNHKCNKLKSNEFLRKVGWPPLTFQCKSSCNRTQFSPGMSNDTD